MFIYMYITHLDVLDYATLILSLREIFLMFIDCRAVIPNDVCLPSDDYIHVDVIEQ